MSTTNKTEYHLIEAIYEKISQQ